jgi:hypothetical protein
LEVFPVLRITCQVKPVCEKRFAHPPLIGPKMMFLAENRKVFLNKGLISTNMSGTARQRRTGAANDKKRAARGGSGGKKGRKSDQFAKR